MKRDMDLCREILIEIESWPTTRQPKAVKIDGHAEDKVGYHAWLLREAGLIEGMVLPISTPVHICWPQCLTYQGHDFLEQARNDTHWERAKNILVNNGGPVTVQAMKTILEALTKAALEALMKGGIGL